MIIQQQYEMMLYGVVLIYATGKNLLLPLWDAAANVLTKNYVLNLILSFFCHVVLPLLV